MDDQNKNLLLATVLSAVVILIWFVAGPMLFPTWFPSDKPALTALPTETATTAATPTVADGATVTLSSDGDVDMKSENFVANDTYYPPEVLANPRFQERLQREVPARRIGRPEETAELALYLCGDGARQVRGVAWAMDGGWTAQ